MSIINFLQAPSFSDRAQAYVGLAPAIQESLFNRVIERKFPYSSPWDPATIKAIINSKQDFPNLLDHTIRSLFVALPEIEKGQIIQKAMQQKNIKDCTAEDIITLHSLMQTLEDPSQEGVSRAIYKQLDKTMHFKLHAHALKIVDVYDKYYLGIDGKEFDGSEVFKSRYAIDKRLWGQSIKNTLNSILDVFFLYELMGRDFQDERSNISKTVARNGMTLQFVSEEFKNNKEIVKIAVGQNGMALEFASERLRNDAELVEIAVAKTGCSYQFAGHDCKNNEELVKLALSKDGMNLRYLPESFLKNPKMIAIAVTENGWTLCRAPKELQNDKKIVKIAVSQNGQSLQFASPLLRKDPEVVSLAVTNDAAALEHTSLKLQKDQGFILDCIGFNAKVYEHTEIEKNQSFQLDAAKRNLDVLSYFDISQGQKIVSSCKENVLAFTKDNPRFFEQMRESNLFTKIDKQQIQQHCIDNLEESLKSCRDEHLKLFYHNLVLIKNADIRDFFLHSLCRLSSDALNVIFSQITPLIKGEAANSKLKLIEPLFAIFSSSADENTKIELKKHVLAKKKIFKDSSKLQPLLLLFRELFLQNRKELYAITSQAFQVPSEPGANDILVKRISYLYSLLLFKPEHFINLTDATATSNLALVELLIHDLTVLGVQAPSGNSTKIASYLLSLRKPHALLTYIANHKNDPKMVQAIKRMLETEMEGTFLHERHFKNFHRQYLNDKQITAWEDAIDTDRSKAILACNPPKEEDFSVTEFLYTKIFRDNHDHDRFAKIKPYIESLQKGAACEKPLHLDDLEQKVLDLLEASDLLQSLQRLKKALQESKDCEHIEFSNDITAAIHSLNPQEIENISLIDTENAEDIFLSGTEVSGSCQRVDGLPRLNRCLMGYVLDGKTRLLAVKNSSGSIIARVMIKLLLTEQNDPVLFIERCYGDQKLKGALFALAREKAASMQVPLLEAGHDVLLHSLGCPAPYEYEDGGIGVSEGGIFTIKGKHI